MIMLLTDEPVKGILQYVRVVSSPASNLGLETAILTEGFLGFPQSVQVNRPRPLPSISIFPNQSVTLC
jgi:hypothetical protein